MRGDPSDESCLGVCSYNFLLPKLDESAFQVSLFQRRDTSALDSPGMLPVGYQSEGWGNRKDLCDPRQNLLGVAWMK